MRLYEFVIERKKDERRSLPMRHWWDRFDSAHRKISSEISGLEYFWNSLPNNDTGAKIHLFKLIAREYGDHPDYSPRWDSNELFVA